MPSPTFCTQRHIGDQLLAAGWHPKSIAIPTRPGSAWVLTDPTGRIRVRMNSDLTPILAEATTTGAHDHPFHPQPWGITVHYAPPQALIQALTNAPTVRPGGTATDRRTIIRALRTAGMRPDRSPLVRALAGTGVWTDPDRDAEAVWIAPYKARPGGWSILTRHATTYLDATASTPAAVLTPLITARSTEEPTP